MIPFTPESHSRQPCSGLLETMNTLDVAAFQPEVVVIVLGSTEPHGPHLPYGTDTIQGGDITAAAVQQANASGARVLRLPVLPFGNNVNFKKLPFACRIRVETLMAILLDLVDFVLEEGIRKVIIVNGHGGNHSTVQAALRQLYDRFQQEIFICSCGVFDLSGGEFQKNFHDGSPHAGDVETSMMMHLAPRLVVPERFKPTPCNRECIPSLASVQWVRPWHLLMPQSYAGTPEVSTAEKGEAFIKACTQGLANLLFELSREPWHPCFPYTPAPQDR